MRYIIKDNKIIIKKMQSTKTSQFENTKLYVYIQ